MNKAEKEATDIYLQSIVEKIQDKIPYIDRVNFWLPTDRPNFDVKALKNYCGREPRVTKKPMYLNPTWRCLLELFQPTEEAFIYLQWNIVTPYLINHFQPSLDFITEDLTDAETVKDFFIQHLIKRWQRGEIENKIGSGFYFKERKAASNLLGYHEKLSKINSRPSCHIEMRLQGSVAVKRAGIGRFEDLINFNHRTFWNKHLQLRRIKDVELIGKAIIKLRGKAQPFYTGSARRRTGSLFLRGHAQVGDANGGMITAQGLLANGRAFNGARHLEEIPNEHFLPE